MPFAKFFFFFWVDCLELKLESQHLVDAVHGTCLQYIVILKSERKIIPTASSCNHHEEILSI